MRRPTVHVCGLNEDENLQGIGQYRVLRPDTWPRKRMLMNKLLGTIDEAKYDLESVVVCKGPFDQHMSNCIENLMTEREEIKRFLIAPSQSCTIARMAKTDGIVLELGESGASCCTIYDGTILKGSMFKNSKIGGLKLVNEFLQMIYLNKGYDIPPAMTYLVGNYILRRYGFVCYGDLYKNLEELNQATNALSTNTKVTLPDGNQIMIDRERYAPYEILFHAERSVPVMLADTLSILDTWGRADMKDQIIISGGLKDTPGLPQRIEETQVNKLISKTFLLSPEFTEGAVQGGVLLGSLLASTREDAWVTRKACEELGYGRVANMAFGLV